LPVVPGAPAVRSPVPLSESLQASAAILQQNIRTIQEIITENSGLFNRLAVHPSTNFPGRTQEHILLSLLRKKLEPEIEGWVEEARETARAAGLDESKLAGGVRERGEHDYDDEDTYDMDQEDDVPSDPFNEQWADMRDAFQHTLQEYVTVQVKKKYTVEEQALGIENVRTGLRQTLEESDEEEEDEEEEEEGDEEVAAAAAGAGPAVAGGEPVLEPEHLFCLAARGDLNLIPADFPFESTRARTVATRRPAPPR
jgi:mediator of RNA polymerase II transcription subunit 8